MLELFILPTQPETKVEKLMGWMRAQRWVSPCLYLGYWPALRRVSLHLSAHPADVMSAWERVFLADHPVS